MSLLMDALKRAERARQAEADRAKAGGDAPSTPSELSLDPIDYPADEREASAVNPPTAPLPGSDTEDSLELTPPDVRRQIESMEDSAFEDSGPLEPPALRAVPNAGGVPRQDGGLPLSLEYGDIPLDETGATLPSMRAAQRSVQDYFDGTHSMSLSMDDMQEALSLERESAPDPEPRAHPGAGTLDGDTTSRRQAQAVLDARAVAPSRTGRTVAALALVLLVLAGIGGSALLFKDRLLAMLDGESDLVLHQPPLATSTPPGTMIVTRTEKPKVLPAEERDALLRAAAAAREEERRLAEAAAAEARAAEARAEQARAEQARAEQAAANAATGGAGSPAPAPAAAPQRPAPAPAGDVAAAVPSSDGVAAAASPGERVALADVMRSLDGGPGPLSGVKISKRRRQTRTQTALQQGFDAFQRGDDGAAMSAYQTVLAREPRNRDAMLGAAAVMMRSGSVDAASQYYAELLRMNPRDGAAQAALIALQDDLDPASGETHVKNLLARAPQDAGLHFTLGNLYAEQGRWPEAQQAYFEAYRLDDANPDFAFNLAVALDRLVQDKAAAAYYRRAMELSERRQSAFESAAAARRLAALEGS